MKRTLSILLMTGLLCAWQMAPVGPPRRVEDLKNFGRWLTGQPETPNHAWDVPQFRIVVAGEPHPQSHGPSPGGAGSAATVPPRIDLRVKAYEVASHDTQYNVTATPYNTLGRKSSSSTILWSTSPGGRLKVIPLSAKAQTVNLVGLKEGPEPVTLIATWRRTDLSISATARLWVTRPYKCSYAKYDSVQKQLRWSVRADTAAYVVCGDTLVDLNAVPRLDTSKVPPIAGDTSKVPPSCGVSSDTTLHLTPCPQAPLTAPRAVAAPKAVGPTSQKRIPVKKPESDFR